MISKLSGWIWPVAWILAFVGGMINVVGFLGAEHQAITHLTGTSSLLAAAATAQDWHGARRLAAFIACFVFGSAIGGLLLGGEALFLGRRHAVAFGLETLLLGVSIPLLTHGGAAGICTAAAACGLQNAMTSTYSGGIFRTTHLSGMFTDLGIFLGHWLRGLPVDHRRLHVCVVVLTGFIVGGIVAAGLFRVAQARVLFVPVVITGVATLVCANSRRSPQAR